MKRIKATLLFAMLIVVFFACDMDEGIQSFDNGSFESVIDLGGVPEEVIKEEKVLDSTVTDQTLPDGTTWQCTTRKVSVVDGNSEFPLFNPNASVIYPGSLLQGKSLSNATPSLIPVKRAGGRISIDVVDGNVQPSFTVNEVTKSNIAEASNSIIAGSSGIVPANFNFSATQVQSIQQLAIGLGLNVESQFVQVASDFSFRQDKEYSRFLVKLNQSFFTLSFDIPGSVKDIFAPGVTPDQLSQYIGPGNPATFISDVTYGRVYYMLVESSSSSMEIEAAISVSFNSPTVGGGLEVNTDFLSSLSDLQIKVVAFGGESASTFPTIGDTNIGNLVSMLGKSTDIRAGVPISYVVRSVKSKEIVSVKLATEYDIRECTPLSTPMGEPMLMWDAGNLMVTEDNPTACADCIEYNGKLRYFAPNDSYAFDNVNGGDGIAVKKWPDLSANGIDASPIAGDPHSRPIFVQNAFDNGRPAVDFFRGKVGHDYVHSRMTYAGDIFVDKEYTLFAVVSYPDKSMVETRLYPSNQWFTLATMPNPYGYFMSGSGEGPLSNLILGFQNASTFRFSHRTEQVFIDSPQLKPMKRFQVIAIRFSKTKGMSIFLNGEHIATDASRKQPLKSNVGAMINAPQVSNETNLSRVSIGEIRAYATAATDVQIDQETKALNLKYGL